MVEIGRTATNRHWYPNELPISPHGDRLDHTPFPQSIIPQRNPQKCWPSNAVSVNEPKSGTQKAEVIVDRFVGEVGYDGVCEGGKNVEAEYKSCQCPKWTV